MYPHYVITMVNFCQWLGMGVACGHQLGGPAVGKPRVRSKGARERSGACIMFAADAYDKSAKRVRCGECSGCTGTDCGDCANCLDKPRFGGAGTQDCLMCVAPKPLECLPRAPTRVPCRGEEAGVFLPPLHLRQAARGSRSQSRWHQAAEEPTR